MVSYKARHSACFFFYPYLTKTSRRVHGERGHWTRTVYTIELNPKRYQDCQTGKEEQENLFSTLEMEGMMGDGWGFAPRLVMQDPRLSIREKALYVYILTYAAAGRVAYPDVPTITYHLGISEDTYRKLIQRLCSLGYILRQRRRKSNGQLGGYDYFICRKPTTLYGGAELPQNEGDPATPFKRDTVKPDTEATTPLKQDTVKQDSEATPSKQDTVNATTPLQQDTVKPDTANQDTGNPDTANGYVRLLQDSTNTSFTITSDYDHKTKTTTGTAGGSEGQTAALQEKIEKAGGIPSDLLDDEAKVIDTLRVLADWDWKSGKVLFYDPEVQSAFCLVMDTLVTLCTRKTSRISNLNLTREQIVEKLNRCCEKDQFGTSLSEFIFFAADEYAAAIDKRRESGKSPVRDPAKYAACVIWSSTDSYLHDRWMQEQEEHYFF